MYIYIYIYIYICIYIYIYIYSGGRSLETWGHRQREVRARRFTRLFVNGYTAQDKGDLVCLCGSASMGVWVCKCMHVFVLNLLSFLLVRQAKGEQVCARGTTCTRVRARDCVRMSEREMCALRLKAVCSVI